MGKKNQKKKEKKQSKISKDQERNDRAASESLFPELLKFNEKIREIEDEIKSLKNKSKDAKAKKSKLESDKRTYEKEVKQAGDKLKRAEDELDKLGENFVYNPSEQGSERNDQGLSKMLSKKGAKNKQVKKGSVPSISLPKEDFPTIGTLYADKNGRFLEISYEEEIEEGKKQAEYFKAKLVVKETA